MHHSRTGRRGPKAWGWRTVVCIASGPSLTADDCERVRQWRHARPEEEGRRVVCVNTTFRMTPWADAVFAIDRDWWKQYGAEVQGLACERLSMRLNRHGAKPAGIGEHGNSGAGAISLAALRGASRVILLGYDVQYTGGKRHWHGDHPRSLGNAGSIAQWPEHFEKVAKLLIGVEIINCSRETALRCFPRERLEVALCSSVD